MVNIICFICSSNNMYIACVFIILQGIKNYSSYPLNLCIYVIILKKLNIYILILIYLWF